MVIGKNIDLEEQYDKIYRYCYFKLHNREKAEDITQEVFLRFLQSATYKDTGRTLQYLYTIARNLCIDEYRRREPEELTEDMVGQAAELTTEAPENTLLTSIIVKAALAELPKEERELVLLRYVNEVSVHDICGMFGISRFALYRRLNKVMAQLKKRLGEEDGQ